MILPHEAGADEPTDPETGYEAEVRAPAPAPPVEDNPGFAISIDARDSAERATSLPQLLERSPGVQSRTLGGLAGFATVSVRGSAANQVLVLLDGVPLGSGGLTRVNVNALAPDILERVDVYRSGAPLWLGAAPMGGVVNLVTRRELDGALMASASYGSFQTRKATLLAATPLLAEPSWDVLVGATYVGTAGDFAFHDDRGTPLNPDDDGEVDRRNNAVDSGQVLLRTTAEPADGLRLVLQEHLRLEDRGIPGLGQNQSRHASFQSLRSLTQLQLEALAWPGTRSDLRLRLDTDQLGERLDDPDGEIGLGERDIRVRGAGYGGQVRVSLFPAAALSLDAVAEARWEQYRAEERRAESVPETDAERSEVAPSLSVQLTLLDGRLLLTAGGRAEVAWSAVAGDLPFAYSPIAPDPERQDSLLTGQLGLRISPAGHDSPVQVQATFGRFARLPTFVEMFGDSGAVIGNGALVPESSLGGDVGVTLRGATGPIEGTAVIAAFTYRYEDIIQLVQNAQRVARAENVASARIDGLEVGLDAEGWGVVALGLAYTLTDAIDTSPLEGQADRALPGRPEHMLRASLGAHGAGVEGEYTLDFESGNALDRAGFRQVPDRLFHGARLGYTPPPLPAWTLTIEAWNLLDSRVESVPVLPSPPGVDITTLTAVGDYLGFPLPGRTVMATLAWEPQMDTAEQD